VALVFIILAAAPSIWLFLRKRKANEILEKPE